MKAVYPGTFDPFTNGHRDIALRAADLFGSVGVAVAQSSKKGPMFNLHERVEMAAAYFEGDTRIHVLAFDGLLAQLMTNIEAYIIVRGIRSTTDFEYEFQMAAVHRQLYPHFETVFLTPASEQTPVSSSMVRELARFGVDVSRYVHPMVSARLVSRVSL